MRERVGEGRWALTAPTTVWLALDQGHLLVHLTVFQEDPHLEASSSSESDSQVGKETHIRMRQLCVHMHIPSHTHTHTPSTEDTEDVVGGIMPPLNTTTS